MEECQKGLSDFIWAGKRPRVKLNILQDARERGGLKVPNLKLYFYAELLTAVSDWINLSECRILQIEGWDMILGWHAYLIYGKKNRWDF